MEPWDELTAQEADFLEPMMEVYAAMVDRLDQNVGRLVDHLKSTDQLDNTLIVFFSDNGACPYQRLRTERVVPGPAESEIAYDARWANMCNTPLRLYKQYAHHGGTLTPMIAHWPARIKDRGALCAFPSHLVDLMPTVVELSGAEYPTEVDQQEIAPMEGVSLIAALEDPKTQRLDRPIFWEFAGNHAIRDGRWKLVAERSKDWELYDMAKDRSETIDLADESRETVQRLAAKYDEWAMRTGAKTHQQCLAMKPSGQSQLFDLDALVQ